MAEKQGKVCCVTGHRPKGFPWDYNDTKSASHQEYLEAMACYIDLIIRKDNVDYFIAGGAIGVDMDFAEIVLDFRDHVYDHIRLEIAVPCKGQDARWSESDKARYKSILDRATRSPYSRRITRIFVCRNATSLWWITPISFSPFGTRTRKRAAP